MWRWALGLPGQLAYEAPGLEHLRTGNGIPHRIIVAGMGGSGVSGKFLDALSNGGNLPIIPWPWAGAPQWLSKDDALLAISYSGETTETLTTLRDGLERGARVIGISSGGKFTDLFTNEKLPLLKVPEGMPPRAAFGFLLGTSLRVVERLAGVKLWEPVETIETLRILCSELSGEEYASINEQVRPLKDRPLVIYGTCPLTAAAAIRLKQQLNENAKVYAWANTLPELAHNEIEGAGPGVPPQRICLTLADKPPPLDEVLRDGVQTIYLKGTGPNPLAAVLGLVLHGDLLSLALARERGVEPEPIERIEDFKKRGWTG